jgi:glycosyltransferase involved in cell wall biosynthesis
MWAARFDKQKRLDLLADIAEECSRVGLLVEWHVYGAPVIESGDESAEHVARLEAVGATFHGTYASFAELPLDSTDLFLMTSESEGIPLTLLDVLAHQVPVMAPMVGGVPELVSDRTGWPIERFDDVSAYVSALREVAADPDAARIRAAAGYDLIEREFSWPHFEQLLAELPSYLPD